MISLADKVYAVSDTVMVEPLESGLALTRVGGDRIFVLNATGAATWQLIDGCTPCHQIASTLAQRFSLPIEKVTRDVYAFIERLVAANLVVEQNP